MLNLVKNGLCFVGYKSGFLSAFEILTSKKVIILMYHKISRKNFSEQMSYLSKKNFKFVDLDYVEAFALGKIEVPYERAVAITFDDGYLSTLKECHPILLENGAPSTIFVSPGHIERKDLYWWDKLKSIITNSRVTKFTYRKRHFNLSSSKQKYECYKTLLKILKELTLSSREKDLELLTTKLNSINSTEKNVLLNWNQMRNVLQKNTTFGGHTMYHTIMTNEKEDEIMKDLKISKQLMEKRLGSKTRHFAYPNGNFDTLSKSIVRASGYRTGLCTRPGFVSRGSDLYELNRVGISSLDDKYIFATKISGLFPTILYNNIISGVFTD